MQPIIINDLQQFKDILKSVIIEVEEEKLGDPNKMLSEQETISLMSELSGKKTTHSTLAKFRREGLVFCQGQPSRYRRGDVVEFIQKRFFRKRSYNQ